MDKDYRDFNIAKKIRIATVVVLVLCALAATIAWALVTMSIDVPGNKFTLGQVHVEVGYYEGGSLRHEEMIKYDEADMDSYVDDPSISPLKRPKPEKYSYKYKNRFSSYNPYFEGIRWGAARNFYVKNNSDIDCYYRIYFEPTDVQIPDPAGSGSTITYKPPHHLGDYLEVNIWKIVGYDSGKPYYGTYTDEDGTHKIYDNTDSRVVPIVKNVPANEFAIKDDDGLGIRKFDNTAEDKWIDYNLTTDEREIGCWIGVGETQDLHLELTYSDRMNNEAIDESWNDIGNSWKQYGFNICVEAVQARNQDPANVEFD